MGRLACQFDAYLTIKQGFLLVLGIAVAPLALGFGFAALGAACGWLVGAAPGGARIGGWLGGVFGLSVTIYSLFRATRMAFEIIGIFQTLRNATRNEVQEVLTRNTPRRRKSKRASDRTSD